MNVVLPMAKLLERELTDKLEVELKLKFDTYPLWIWFLAPKWSLSSPRWRV